MRTVQIALPIVFGQLGHIFTGLADSAMVGQIGYTSLAAVSLGHNVFVIFLVFGMGLTMGLTPHVATADGAKDIQSNIQWLRNGLYINGLTGLLMSVGMLLGLPLVYYLNQPPEVIEEGWSYMQVVALSLFPLMIFQHYKQYAEGLSYTKVAMYISLGGNLLNIILNYFLIFGVWIFPRMELFGAGVATLIARVGMAVCMALYVYRGKPFIAFRPGFVFRSISLKHILEILRVGVPVGFQFIFEVGAFVAGAFMVGWLGAIPLAAHQVAISLAAATFMGASGISAAVTVRIGKFAGAIDPRSLKESYWTGIILVLIYMGTTALGFVLFRNLLPMLFTPNPEVQNLAASLLIVAAVFQLSDGLQVVGLGALRGLKDVQVPTILALISYWGVGIPVGYLLGIELNWGAQGIWWGLAAGLTTSSLLMFARFRYILPRLFRSVPKPTEQL